jgi:hypothetical protein
VTAYPVKLASWPLVHIPVCVPKHLSLLMLSLITPRFHSSAHSTSHLPGHGALRFFVFSPPGTPPALRRVLSTSPSLRPPSFFRHRHRPSSCATDFLFWTTFSLDALPSYATVGAPPRRFSGGMELRLRQAHRLCERRREDEGLRAVAHTWSRSGREKSGWASRTRARTAVRAAWVQG